MREWNIYKKERETNFLYKLLFILIQFFSFTLCIYKNGSFVFLLFIIRALAANILKKYYSPEYYKDIFGYDLTDGLELSNINGYPKPTKLYTWCQVHLIERGGIFETTDSLTKKQAKTYVKFSQNSPQLFPVPKPCPVTVVRNFTDLTEAFNAKVVSVTMLSKSFKL